MPAAAADIHDTNKTTTMYVELLGKTGMGSGGNTTTAAAAAGVVRW